MNVDELRSGLVALADAEPCDQYRAWEAVNRRLREHRSRRRATIAVVALAGVATAVVGFVFLTSSDTRSVALGPGPLQLRPVLAALPPATSNSAASAAADAAIASCDINQVAALPDIPSTTDPTPDACVVLPFKSGAGTGRLYLGPARLTTADLDSATSSFQSGAGYVVDMKLTTAGLAEFNRLAADSFSKSSPQDQVAIVVDGQIYSNPRFETGSFSSPIQISGSFSNAEAAALAEELNRAILTR